jgi:hypothetical protein
MKCLSPKAKAVRKVVVISVKFRATQRAIYSTQFLKIIACICRKRNNGLKMHGTEPGKGKAEMRVYCKNCRFKGFSESAFCTFEDRFINTGDFRSLKKDKNIKGLCRDYEPGWLYKALQSIKDSFEKRDSV